MLTFIIRRLLWTVLVMFVITVVVFILFFKTPGVDPARAIAGRSPNPQTLAEIRAQLGLGRPFPIEYGIMMKKIFITRDLVSYSNQGVRVVQEVFAATPATLSLVFGAAVLWVVLAIAVGIAARVCAFGLRPARARAGSTPGVLKKMMNTTTVITNMTSTVHSRRRMMNVSMSGGPRLARRSLSPPPAAWPAGPGRP